MTQVFDILATLLWWLIGLLITLLTVVVSYQVFSRYLDLLPRILWTEEVARFTFLWMLFLGAALAVRQGRHFTIDLFGHKLSGLARRISQGLVLLVVGGVGVFMVVGGAEFFDMGMRRVSTTSGIRLAWIYLALPVSGAGIAAFAAEALVKVVRGEDPDADAAEGVNPVSEVE